MNIRILNKQGGGYITPCIITLVIAMILSAVLFYANTMTMIQSARENTRIVLDGFVTKNSISIYDSIKKGSDFTQSIDENLYVASLLSFYRLGNEQNMLYHKDSDGNVLYKMTCPNVDFEYANTLKLRATYDVIIPVSFAGHHLFDMSISQKVTAYYNLK